MKHALLLAALLALALPCALKAQDDNMPGPGPGGEPPPDGGGEFHRGDRPGPEMVDKWLEKLKERNPEEYARLMKLRQDDPEAFRMELHKKLKTEQARKFLDEHPQLRDAVMALSPQEREAIMNRLAQPPGPDHHGPGMMDGGDMHSPEMDALQQQAQKLVASYKSASTPGDQDKIKAELKTTVTQLFDMREKKREQDIARFEEHLADLKSHLEKRKANRDQIIEKKLEEMVSSDEMSW